MTSATSTQRERGVMPVRLDGQRVLLLDQRKLPGPEEWFDATELSAMSFAIKEMVVRGAPSIGVAAAFGRACEAVRLAKKYPTAAGEFLDGLAAAKTKLQETRPTAVNLRWGTEQIFALYERLMETGASPGEIGDRGMVLAAQIMEDHVQCNRRLSEYGAHVVPAQASIITHCNAGPLATSGWGTALGVIRYAAMEGKEPHVFVDETRPRNQGAKLTMWELHQDKIDCTLICDSMSAFVMKNKSIDLCVVGADRIARNGDTANKIGTYGLAVVAHHHGVPFYVAAPLSTIDPRIETGADIPIEERDGKELLHTDSGASGTVAGATAFNPSFDVTPASLIAGIITVHHTPNRSAACSPSKSIIDLACHPERNERTDKNAMSPRAKRAHRQKRSVIPSETSAPAKTQCHPDWKCRVAVEIPPRAHGVRLVAMTQHTQPHRCLTTKKPESMPPAFRFTIARC